MTINTIQQKIGEHSPNSGVAGAVSSDVLSALRMLAAAYPSAKSVDDTWAVYAIVLSDIPAYAVKEAVIEYIKTHAPDSAYVKLPTPAHLLRLANLAMARHTADENADAFCTLHAQREFELEQVQKARHKLINSARNTEAGKRLINAVHDWRDKMRYRPAKIYELVNAEFDLRNGDINAVTHTTGLYELFCDLMEESPAYIEPG